MATDPHRCDAESLATFARRILQTVGLPIHDARVVASCLVTANLEGVDTHGIMRLPTYVRRITKGLANPNPRVRVVRQRYAAVLIEGDNGLGPVVGTIAMDEAVRRAQRYGIAWVNVRNSNHFSYAGFYCKRAAARGLIGICPSSGEPCVAPWGGRLPFFSNNPFALAAPTRGAPIVVDMAMSVASRGHILVAKQLRNKIPLGWAMDRRGCSTRDPAEALAGSVLPLGGPKGYALIVALEILTGVLAGGAFAPHVGSQYKEWNRPTGVSHFFLAVDPVAFMRRSHFLDRVQRLVAAVHRAPRRPGVERILLPGEGRKRSYADRSRRGIPVHPRIIDELESLAGEVGAPVEGLL